MDTTQNTENARSELLRKKNYGKIGNFRKRRWN